MKRVNALKMRRALGDVLDQLERTGEPIIVEKGREPRAVLVPVRLFHERFVDKTVHEERLLLEQWFTERQKAPLRKGPSAEKILRELRGQLP
jgi:prevent-host-death family protein